VLHIGYLGTYPRPTMFGDTLGLFKRPHKVYIKGYESTLGSLLSKPLRKPYVTPFSPMNQP
jgi:hypothetical protein